MVIFTYIVVLQCQRVFTMHEGSRYGKGKNALLLSCCISVCVLICIALARLTSNAVLATSVAASAFIAFAYPKADSSRARILVGGYVCGIIAGSGFGVINLALAAKGAPVVVFNLLAVFACSFAMLYFGLQHPPAAALAFSLSMDASPLLSGLLAFAAVICICLAREVIYKFINSPQCVRMYNKTRVRGKRFRAPQR